MTTIPGGDFAVTLTHTAILRIPDPAVVADALGLHPADAMTEIADVLGVKGLRLDELDALPLDSFEIVRVDRVTTDVDRIERYEFTDGGDWTMRVPVDPQGDADTVTRPTTFVVTDQPLSEQQALAVRELLRRGAAAGVVDNVVTCAARRHPLDRETPLGRQCDCGAKVAGRWGVPGQ